MDGQKNRADPERFFPKGESSVEGALKKMSYLKQFTDIRVQVPLKAQIYEFVQANPSGLTVKEISQKMCLNTKTCAKVLEEMIYKYSELKATAHRYGRVFVHKYHINAVSQEIPKELDLQEYLSGLNPEIIEEINEIEKDLGETIRLAISQSLKSGTLQSRQRITHQSYVRALFVIARIRKLRVCSVFDIKEMIKNELEPNAKWCLDKKTVLRIIWKLRNCGLLKELCFRIKLRKDDDHEISFLGEHYSVITQDKLQNKSSTVMYKLLAALPEVLSTDTLVSECPAIKNPTNRKPFTQNQSAAAKTSINIKGKILREIVVIQNVAYKKLKNAYASEDVIENILRMEGVIKGEENENESGKNCQEALSKGYSLAIFTKAVFKMLTLLLFSRYKSLFAIFRMPLCYTALKEICNAKSLTSTDGLHKNSLAYENFQLEKPLKVPDFEGLVSEIDLLIPISLPKKRKHTLEEMSYQLKKLFILMERKPGLVRNDVLKFNGKGIDTDVVVMLKYISDLGFVQCRAGSWEVKHNNSFIYTELI